MGLHLARISLSLVARLPESVYERYLAASPYVVGEQLVEQITGYTRTHQLGYYPALDYFQQQGGLDPDLLDAAEQIAWFSANIVREEIQRKLRPVFSTVTFQGQQNIAFTMPAIRPHQPNAYNALLEHYTPDRIKANIVVSSFQKQEQGEALVKWTANTCYRWLKESFDTFEVSNAQRVE